MSVEGEPGEVCMERLLLRFSSPPTQACTPQSAVLGGNWEEKFFCPYHRVMELGDTLVVAEQYERPHCASRRRSR
jgi:hypothetical protein